MSRRRQPHHTTNIHLGVGAFVVALALSVNLATAGAIHDESQSGDLEGVKALLEGSPGLVSSKDDNGDTPLHEAAFADHKEIAALLLAHGADVNAKDNGDLTPLHLAAGKGNNDVAELLLAKGAEVNAMDASGATPLHWAAGRNQLEIVKLLIAHGADLNAKDNDGDPPLTAAQSRGNAEVVKYLLLPRGGRTLTSQPSTMPTAPELENSVTNELKEITRKLVMSSGLNVNFTSVHGSFSYSGHRLTGSFSFKGAAVMGGDYDGESLKDYQFSGSWDFTGDAGLKSVRVDAQVGSTYKFNGKRFKLTKDGWIEQK